MFFRYVGFHSSATFLGPSAAYSERPDHTKTLKTMHLLLSADTAYTEDNTAGSPNRMQKETIVNHGCLIRGKAVCFCRIVADLRARQQQSTLWATISKHRRRPGTASSMSDRLRSSTGVEERLHGTLYYEAENAQQGDIKVEVLRGGLQELF